MPRSSAAARGTRFERFYSIVVAIKGVDGLIELVAGILLLVAPAAASDLLTAAATELAEGSSPLRALASRTLGAAGAGVGAASVPLAVFLLVHGVVKLLTVYCLLRRALRWYPWALGALVVLLALQVIDLVTAPSVGGVVLGVLDVLVIVLVSWECRRLQRESAAQGTGPREDVGMGAR